MNKTEVMLHNQDWKCKKCNKEILGVIYQENGICILCVVKELKKEQKKQFDKYVYNISITDKRILEMQNSLEAKDLEIMRLKKEIETLKKEIKEVIDWIEKNGETINQECEYGNECALCDGTGLIYLHTKIDIYALRKRFVITQ